MSTRLNKKKKALLVMMATTLPASSKAAVPSASVAAFVSQNVPNTVAHLGHPCKLRGDRDDVIKKLLVSTNSFDTSSSKEDTAELIASPSPLDTSELLTPDVPDWLTAPLEKNKKSLRSVLNLETTQAYHPQRHNRVRPMIVGHRGSIYQELENTRQGFLQAYQEGCDAVELDVFLLKCGTLAVFHGGGTDENPGDLTDYCNAAETSILQYTYEECLKLSFNSHHPEFACGPDRVSNEETAYIPTLEQVLLDAKSCPERIVKIELKGPGTAKPVLELVERLEMVSQCHFSSFDHSRIQTIRHLRPQTHNDGSHVYKTGALFSDVPDNFVQQALAVGASEVHLKYDTCTTKRIQAIHDAGMDSMAWFRGPIGMRLDVMEKYHDIGNEDHACYSMVMETGVRQLCVNRPDVLADLLLKKSMQNGFERNTVLTA